MFTMQNTENFTQTDLDLMNEALKTHMAQYTDVSDDDRYQIERAASDRISNNWQTSDNTVENLLRGL